MNKYKVLSSDMQSPNGYHQWGVGVWYDVGVDPVLCERGFHWTNNPLAWVNRIDDRIFICETAGDLQTVPDITNTYKSASRRMCLIRECDISDEFPVLYTMRQIVGSVKRVGVLSRIGDFENWFFIRLVLLLVLRFWGTR